MNESLARVIHDRVKYCIAKGSAQNIIGFREKDHIKIKMIMIRNKTIWITGLK